VAKRPRERTDYIVIQTSKTDSKQDWGKKELYWAALDKCYLDVVPQWFIRRCGTLCEGRNPEGPAMSLDEKKNWVSVLIYMIGGMENKKPAMNFTRSQLLTLRDLLATLKAKHPEATVECPEFDLNEAMKGLP
jgi:hypothetical protein